MAVPRAHRYRAAHGCASPAGLARARARARGARRGAAQRPAIAVSDAG